MKKIATAAALMSLVFANAAFAEMDAQNSDEVLPNSPFKASMPDAGVFNPVGEKPPYVRPKRVVIPPPIAFPERTRVYAERQPSVLQTEPMYEPAQPRRRRADRN